MLKIDKPGLAPQKESIFGCSCRLWLLSLRRARVFARSCSLLSKYLPISWKQRKEQSHAQCHVTHRIRIFDKIFEHVKVAKSVDIAVPELAVTSLPGLYAWRPCHAERLALNTSPHHECNPRGSRTGDVATVQWHCHLLLIGQPWGLASSHPENLHRPETVETELARELENHYSKMHLEIDQIQDSIHQSKKHHFFSTSFLQKSK